MRILLAHNHLKPIGGAEVFYLEVGRVLESYGHEVAYFSPKDQGLDSPYLKYFPEVIDYKKSGILGGLLNIKNLVYNKEAKNKFNNLIQDFKPDLVHVFAIYVRLTPSILDACKENNVPVIMSCNDYKHICPNYKLFQNGKLCEQCKGGKFYNTVKNKCSKNSYKYSVASALEAYTHEYLNIYRKNVDLFLFASEFMAKKTEEFWGKENFKWSTLKNPFNSNSFENSMIYDDYILYFGRLIDEKGVDVLIKAMKFNKHIPLKIIGNGPYEENLKQLAKDLELKNVSFLGSMWGEELNEVLSKCKFVVVPSVWHENFPYVILQSFALGKAVIGTNRGGIPEMVIDGEFGYVYNAQDDKMLSQKILSLWNNSELNKKMGMNAKKHVDQKFNDQNFYKQIMNAYSQVIK